MRFEKEFRKAHPETVGETDREFDLSNYADWLESLVEEKFTSTNRPSTPCEHEIAERYVCVKCGGIVTAKFD